MDAPNPNPYAEQERALLEWHDRLVEKERTLRTMQTLLIDWSESIAKMARLLEEITTLQRGEPIAQTATGSRPTLKLVPRPDPEKEPH